MQLHPNQLAQWKKTVLDNLPNLFERSAGGDELEQFRTEHEKQMEQLYAVIYAVIGRLTTQLTCTQGVPEKNLVELLSGMVATTFLAPKPGTHWVQLLQHLGIPRVGFRAAQLGAGRMVRLIRVNDTDGKTFSMQKDGEANPIN